MTDTDTSTTDHDDLPAEGAGDDPVQTAQELEDAEDKTIWDALDKEESGEPAADTSAADAAAAKALAEDGADDALTDDGAAAKTDDVWDGASDEQRDAFKASQERGDNLEHSNRPPREGRQDACSSGYSKPLRLSGTGQHSP